jgi:inhibitor of KinA
MTRLSYQIVENGDTAVSIIFDEPIGEKLSTKIIQLAEQLKKSVGDRLSNIIPGYQSLTLCAPQPAAFIDKEIVEIIDRTLRKPLTPLTYKPKSIKIPVCYEDRFAPDLANLATYTGLSKDAVIKFHTAETYLVHMLGFLPGFLYLGGLNSQLACPRKTTPALNIAAGSVGIGGNQTGIYPVGSPGGWHIIGRTPLRLFNPESSQPFIAKPLDKVRFKSISSAQYDSLHEDQQS